MPRTYHYPSRVHRQERALVAASHAQVVQTASQVGKAVTTITEFEEAIGGDLSAITETLTEVGVLAEEVRATADNLKSRVEAIEEELSSA